MAAALRANIRSIILVMDSSSFRPTSLAGFRSPAQAAELVSKRIDNNRKTTIYRYLYGETKRFLIFYRNMAIIAISGNRNIEGLLYGFR
jgi:hypothetical protein